MAGIEDMPVIDTAVGTTYDEAVREIEKLNALLDEVVEALEESKLRCTYSHDNECGLCVHIDKTLTTLKEGRDNERR